MKMITATTAAAMLVMGTGQPAPAATTARQIAYVRSGDIYVSSGAKETRLTTGGNHSRPRWSPDGKRIAYLTGTQLWTMNADGTGPKRLTTRAAGGPAWSPDGKWIAFASLSCTGGPGVYRVPAAKPATPEVLLPRDCRGEELPPEPATTAARAGSLTDRLRTDDAVAWSPDGKKIAFRGGDCESIYDSCLSVGTVATGGETTVAAYGGGSLETQGFAVVPCWRSDGARLSWTAYQQGETTADNQPVHVVELDPATGAKRTVGAAQDRELAYLDATHGVVTGQYRGGSWITLVGLTDGKRQPFHSGSQPSVRPTR
ncbi:TolB family protein [Actinoplanes sp. CA-030573]|uniref:TolB family protein n=1 Tax=Actinoplanes sp. CA-030573 TaxID=3239898 RepID=UPI003D8D355E